MSAQAISTINILIMVLGVGLWIGAARRGWARAWLTDRGRLPTWPIAPTDFGLFLVLLVLFAWIAPAVIVRVIGLDFTPPVPSRTILFGNLLPHLAAIAVCLLFQRLPAGRPPPTTMPATRAAFAGLAAFVLTLPAVFVALYGWTAIVEMAGWPNDEQLQVQLLRDARGTAEFLGWTFFAVVLAPIAEESVFRGGIYRFLASYLRPNAAALVSSLLFAALHPTVRTFVPLVVLGFALCVVYRRTSSLAAPIVLHAVFNLNTVLGTAFGVDS